MSIVTVVYNGEEFLQRTIDSVCAQDYPNIEYVVIDGASRDGTLDIIKHNEEHIDLWVSEPDSGIYEAMNKGIAACTGEFIGMINADDWYVDGAVQLVLDHVKAHPEKNIFHGDIWIDYGGGNKKIKKAKLSGFLLKYWEMVLNHPSFFVRRSYYEGRDYLTDLRVSADHQWTLRAHLEDPDQFHYIPQPIANFNAGGASMSVSLKKVLMEGRKVSRSLNMSVLDTFIGQLVKAALYVPQYMKILFNRHLSPILQRG